MLQADPPEKVIRAFMSNNGLVVSVAIYRMGDAAAVAEREPKTALLLLRSMQHAWNDEKMKARIDRERQFLIDPTSGIHGK